MTAADRIRAAADSEVRSWPHLDAQTRADVLQDLRNAGRVRDCLSGGHTLDVGDAFPQWAADEVELDRLVAGLLVRARALINS